MYHQRDTNAESFLHKVSINSCLLTSLEETWVQYQASSFYSSSAPTVVESNTNVNSPFVFCLPAVVCQELQPLLCTRPFICYLSLNDLTGTFGDSQYVRICCQGTDTSSSQVELVQLDATVTYCHFLKYNAILTKTGLGLGAWASWLAC